MDWRLLSLHIFSRRGDWTSIRSAPRLHKAWSELQLSLLKWIAFMTCGGATRFHTVMCVIAGKLGRADALFLGRDKSSPESSWGGRRGHERVLGARLSDATFFWQMDRKAPLGNRLGDLKGVLFQEKLGSYHDKTERILLLLAKLAERVGATDHLSDLESAGRLCKCDLVTEMVQEFPNLQGIVGGLYAKADGVSENTRRAVYDHYLRRSMSSPSPSTRTGAILVLVDRLDTVTGCFSVGLIPSGSKDPFAVRRQATRS